jgi:predicted TIM-barrel fold metal-dependent hydrolase
MLDGRMLVDAHLHPARLPTVSAAWLGWAERFGAPGWREVYGPDGTIIPAAFDELLAAEGVDHAILLPEYSPKATGVQPVEDLLPVVKHNPARFAFLANLNPHLHYPVAAELARQLELGAAGLKIHPVHGGFSPADPMLYPAYQLCASAGLPVVVHCGTSSFPGSANAMADPVLLDPVLRDFPGLTVVLAHGGRGWWYDAAASLALLHDNVWIELSGVPPQRLPAYYARFSLERLARKFIFGTDWPGVPGIARNARALATLGLGEDTLAAVLAGNALAVYPGLRERGATAGPG